MQAAVDFGTQIFASAAALFLVTAGLTLCFGVLRLVNFAHGALYMIGAYAGVTVLSEYAATFSGFVLSLLLALLTGAVIGATMYGFGLRRMTNAPVLYPLLLTFGYTLVLSDLSLLVFGREDRLAPVVPVLEGSVTVGGVALSVYDLFVVAVSLVIAAGGWFVLKRTALGLLIRAEVENTRALELMGYRLGVLKGGVFALGCALASVGGALRVPTDGAYVGMEWEALTIAFLLSVVGGMGSFLGALIATLLFVSTSLGVSLMVPSLHLLVPYVLSVLLLLLFPQGLARPSFAEKEDLSHIASVPVCTINDRWTYGHVWLLGAIGVVLAAILPPWLQLTLADGLILGVFALSLQWLVSTCGVVVFGHVLSFGVGAYAAALASGSLWQFWMKLLSHSEAGINVAQIDVAAIHILGMVSTVLFSGLVAALCGAMFAMISRRLHETPLAIFSLATALALGAFAHKARAITGGDDGILGFPTAGLQWTPLAQLLIATGFAALMLATIVFVGKQRFGLVSRAFRDAPARTLALGVSALQLRVAQFAFVGAIAGAAGSLTALFKSSVFPAVFSVELTVDAFVAILIGGIASPLGAFVGSGFLAVLRDEFAIFAYWRLFLGGLIVLLCLFAPDGLTSLRLGSRLRAIRNLLGSRRVARL